MVALLRAVVFVFVFVFVVGFVEGRELRASQFCTGGSSCDDKAYGMNLMRKHNLNATCLDGSQAALYLQAEAGVRKWVIFLQGGGVCTAEKDCSQRKLGPLGSSVLYPPFQLNTEGILSSNSKRNPDFFEYGHVFIPYCSGDVWGGTMTAPTNPWSDGEKANEFTFSGHLIFKAAVEWLKDTQDLGEADEIILSGCSAGGIGTFINTDWLAQQFPDARVVGVPVAGWFGLTYDGFQYWEKGLPDPDQNHTSLIAWMDNLPSKPYNFVNTAYQRCVASGKSDEECKRVPDAFPFINTTLFVMENIVDSYQIYTTGLCPRSVNSKTNGYVEYFHELMLTSLQATTHKKGSGVYSPACIGHCDHLWDGSQVGGVGGKEALGAWYFNRASNTTWINPDGDIHTLRTCEAS